ncbi:uncharacterized protein LOC122661559 [Telopea speciosissima]|uniref:uncharacterized protein LOC122661559 n=1 Tax=Telopea speciosissima TaxID=54955 RepID=UPI001CC4E3DF|nr:uncharacterized protein LOC122661559 [Telopea speciosissima]XP_043712936.1 uncharacterized protein LOC122661559 [Telopea speciosissima]XP_043712943.1 uncharacterized protein LOC122661559 [Telopea speciosissima]
MEGIFSVWSYQESIDELKHKLLYTTYELESARMDAKVEMKKNEENVKQLLQLLNSAYHERDEARVQLQKVLNRVTPNSQTEIFSVFPNLQSECAALKPKGLNSSITESDSLSETYNHHSYGSSPVDSFIDAVSSPEMSNMNVGDSCNLGVPQQPPIQECNVPISMDIFSAGNISPSLGTISSGAPKVDHASSVIDNLTKGKPLPQKGKLLQAVMEAGPLLQTVLVAGPLPRWRNPPPLQPFQIPAVSIKGCDPEKINQKPVPSPNYKVQSLFGSSYLEMSSQICSTSLLNLSSSPVSCLDNGELLSTPMNQDFSHRYNSTGKRLRLH